MNVDGACIHWPGSKNYGGYGLIKRRGRTTMAHREAYENVNGPIPDGLDLDHLCRNPSCVNPDHLEAVTHSENQRRSWAARDRPAPSTTRVREIRERVGLTQVQVARAACLTERTMRLLESGVREPRLSTARKIADALGVSVEELFPPGDTAG